MRSRVRTRRPRRGHHHHHRDPDARRVAAALAFPVLLHAAADAALADAPSADRARASASVDVSIVKRAAPGVPFPDLPADAPVAAIEGSGTSIAFRGTTLTGDGLATVALDVDGAAGVRATLVPVDGRCEAGFDVRALAACPDGTSHLIRVSLVDGAGTPSTPDGTLPTLRVRVVFE